MARSYARIEFREGRIIRGESSFRGVVLVDQKLIEPKVIDKGEALIWREVDGVRVGRFLALGIRAVPSVLHESRGLAKFPVGKDGEDCDASAGIVGDQDVLARFVDEDVARIGAAG